ncbi:MAG: hypothetical protein IKR48_06700 [Kiritimatiellae bacterium]|nr:hypothetical protein [Kiritimatiellia bacterium]
MNTTYICTLGTSIANRLPNQLLRDRQEKNLPWNADDSEFEKALCERIRAISKQGDERETCCAETAILSKMKLDEQDKVLLLATDTCLGRMCGDAVQSVLTRCHGLDVDDVSVIRIEGLQVADANRLRNLGLKNLLSTVEKCVREGHESGCDVCLCPNGGYKGVVPFLTLAGMILHCKVVYSFEFAGSVIVLPPLPFALDEQAYLRARDALSCLYDRIEMPTEQFLSMVADLQPEERDRFLGFTEPGTKSGFVTFSPLVGIATTGAEVRTAPLSDQAEKDLEKLAQSGGAAACRRLVLQSQDPLYRAAHSESKNLTDLVAIQRPRTAERVFGYVHDGRFLVCRIFASHNDYIRYMDKQQPRRKDFPPEIFHDVNFEDGSVDEADEIPIEEWGDLKRERDELRKKCEAANEEITVVRQQYNEAKRIGIDAEKKATDFKQLWTKANNELQWLRQKADNLATALVKTEKKESALRSQLESTHRMVEEKKREVADLNERLREYQNRGFFRRLADVFRMKKA